MPVAGSTQGAIRRTRALWWVLVAMRADVLRARGRGQLWQESRRRDEEEEDERGVEHGELAVARGDEVVGRGGNDLDWVHGSCHGRSWSSWSRAEVGPPSDGGELVFISSPVHPLALARAGTLQPASQHPVQLKARVHVQPALGDPSPLFPSSSPSLPTSLQHPASPPSHPANRTPLPPCTLSTTRSHSSASPSSPSSSRGTTATSTSTASRAPSRPACATTPP